MDTTTPKNDGTLPTLLCWDDREQMRQWLTVLREVTHDSFTAGDDATRPFRERLLSRAESRRKLCAAETSIDRLLTLAANALAAA